MRQDEELSPGGRGGVHEWEKFCDKFPRRCVDLAKIIQCQDIKNGAGFKLRDGAWSNLALGQDALFYLLSMLVASAGLHCCITVASQDYYYDSVIVFPRNLGLPNSKKVTLGNR